MDKENEIDNEGINLKDILNIFYKKIWVLIIVTLLCGCVSLVYSKCFVTPLYSSTTRLYIADTTDINLADLQIASSLSTDYIEIMTTTPFVEEVKENLQLKDSYTNNQLKEMINVSNKADTHILDVTATSSDPALSCDLANSFAEVAVEKIPTIMKIDPPKIIEYAIINNDPVSPNVILRTILGLLVGLIISMIGIFLLEFTRNTLKSTDEIKQRLGLEVLGVISDYDKVKKKGDNKDE